VVSDRARSLDFSGIAATVYDFAAGGFPFPANRIPQSRTDPTAAVTIARIPASSAPGTEPNALYASTGVIPSDGHLTLTGNFGGYTNFPSNATRTSVPVSFVLVRGFQSGRICRRNGHVPIAVLLDKCAPLIYDLPHRIPRPPEGVSSCAN
jgi:hypothetical protein